MDVNTIPTCLGNISNNPSMVLPLPYQLFQRSSVTCCLFSQACLPVQLTVFLTKWDPPLLHTEKILFKSLPAFQCLFTFQEGMGGSFKSSPSRRAKFSLSPKTVCVSPLPLQPSWRLSPLHESASVTYTYACFPEDLIDHHNPPVCNST